MPASETRSGSKLPLAHSCEQGLGRRRALDDQDRGLRAAQPSTEGRALAAPMEGGIHDRRTAAGQLAGSGGAHLRIGPCGQLGRVVLVGAALGGGEAHEPLSSEVRRDVGPAGELDEPTGKRRLPRAGHTGDHQEQRLPRAPGEAVPEGEQLLGLCFLRDPLGILLVELEHAQAGDLGPHPGAVGGEE